MLSIPDWILRILVCPRTHNPLRMASAEEIETVNKRISEGTAVNYGGRTVSDPVQVGLVPDSEPVLYPILEGIYVLLVDEAIHIGEAPAAGS